MDQRLELNSIGIFFVTNKSKGKKKKSEGKKKNSERNRKVRGEKMKIKGNV